MTHNSIFSATLGLSPPWRVTSVTFAQEEKRLDIMVEFSPGDNLNCPDCGAEPEHFFTETETWHHDNFLRYSTFLHARVPNHRCCTVLPVARPWARAGSKFGKL